MKRIRVLFILLHVSSLFAAEVVHPEGVDLPIEGGRDTFSGDHLPEDGNRDVTREERLPKDTMTDAERDAARKASMESGVDDSGYNDSDPDSRGSVVEGNDGSLVDSDTREDRRSSEGTDDGREDYNTSTQEPVTDDRDGGGVDSSTRQDENAPDTTNSSQPTEQELKLSKKLDEQFKKFDDLIVRIAEFKTTHVQDTFKIAHLLEKALTDIEADILQKDSNGKTYKEQLKAVEEHTNDHALQIKIEQARAKLSVALDTQRMATFQVVFDAMQNPSTDPVELKKILESLFGLTSRGKVDGNKWALDSADEQAFRAFGESLWNSRVTTNRNELLTQMRMTTFEDLNNGFKTLSTLGYSSGDASENFYDMNNATRQALAKTLRPIVESQMPFIKEDIQMFNRKAQMAVKRNNYQEQFLYAGNSQDVTQSVINIVEKLNTLAESRSDKISLTGIRSSGFISQDIYLQGRAGLMVDAGNVGAKEHALRDLINEEHFDGMRAYVSESESTYKPLFDQGKTTEQIKDLLVKEIARIDRLDAIVDEEVAALQDRYDNNEITESQFEDKKAEVLPSKELRKSQREAFEKILTSLDVVTTFETLVQSAKAELVVVDGINGLSSEVRDSINSNTIRARVNVNQESFNDLVQSLDNAHPPLKPKEAQARRQEIRNLLETIDVDIIDRERLLSEFEKRYSKLDANIDSFEERLKKIDQQDREAQQRRLARDKRVLADMRDSLDVLSAETKGWRNQHSINQAKLMIKEPGFNDLVRSMSNEITLLLAGKVEEVNTATGEVEKVKTVSEKRKIEIMEQRYAEWAEVVDKFDPLFDARMLEVPLADLPRDAQSVIAKMETFKSLKDGLEEVEGLFKAQITALNTSVEMSASLMHGEVKTIINRLTSIQTLSPEIEAVIKPFKQRLAQDQATLEKIATSYLEDHKMLDAYMQGYTEVFTEQASREALMGAQELYTQQNEAWRTMYNIRKTFEQANNALQLYPTIESHRYSAEDFSSLDVDSPDFGKDLLQLLTPEKVLDNAYALEELGRFVLFEDVGRESVWTHYGDEAFGLSELNATIAQHNYEQLGLEDQIDWNNVTIEQLKDVAKKWLEQLEGIEVQNFTLEQLQAIDHSLHIAGWKRSAVKDDLTNTYRSIGTNLVGSQESWDQFLFDFDFGGKDVAKSKDTKLAKEAFGKSTDLSRERDKKLIAIADEYATWLSVNMSEARTGVEIIRELTNTNIKDIGVGEIDSLIEWIEQAKNKIVGGREDLTGHLGRGAEGTSDPTVEPWQHAIRAQLKRVENDLLLLKRIKSNQATTQEVDALRQSMLVAKSTLEAAVKGDVIDVDSFERLSYFLQDLSFKKELARVIESDTINTMEEILSDPQSVLALEGYSTIHEDALYLNYLFGSSASDEQGIITGTLAKAASYQSLYAILQQNPSAPMVSKQQIKVAQKKLPELQKHITQELSLLDNLSKSMQKDPRVEQGRAALNDALKAIKNLSRLIGT